MTIDEIRYRDGSTLYSHVPLMGEPHSIVVAAASPPEAHAQAKEYLIRAIGRSSIPKRIGLVLLRLGHKLLK